MLYRRAHLYFKRLLVVASPWTPQRNTLPTDGSEPASVRHINPCSDCGSHPAEGLGDDLRPSPASKLVWSSATSWMASRLPNGCARPVALRGSGRVQSGVANLSYEPRRPADPRLADLGLPPPAYMNWLNGDPKELLDDARRRQLWWLSWYESHGLRISIEWGWRH